MPDVASGKNHGLFASRGDIVLFLDDDDIAAESLLEEHLKTHTTLSCRALRGTWAHSTGQGY